MEGCSCLEENALTPERLTCEENPMSELISELPNMQGSEELELNVRFHSVRFPTAFSRARGCIMLTETH